MWHIACNILVGVVSHNISKGFFMLRAAIIFFVMGLLAFFFGAYGFAGVSIEVGKLLLVVFLVFSLISFVGGITTDKNLR